MSVSLSYTMKDGSISKAKFAIDVTEISIYDSNIVHMDIGSLSSCHDLRSLSLSNVTVSELDLSPLSSCTNLESFHLHGTQLKSVDLGPLASSRNLLNLVISSNPIQSINLSPLASCRSLMEIKVSSNPIQSIDLSPLASCINLRELQVNHNQIQTIDLQPLAYCQNIAKVVVFGNPIQHINLKPLSSARNLEELILFDNHLKSIDLTPLSSLNRLTGIWLDRNEIEFIDFSPLSSCNALRKISLQENPIQEIDLTPLTVFTGFEIFLPLFGSTKTVSWLHLTSVDVIGGDSIIYNRPSCRYPWAFLYWVIENYGSDYRVQQDVLVAMGLGEYGFIDLDLRDFFLSIPSECGLETACHRVIPLLVEKIVDTANIGGSTIGFEIEKVSAQHPEIARIVPKLVEMRRQEVAHLTIEFNDIRTSMSLRELWLTAYGFEVLSKTKEEVFPHLMNSNFHTFENDFETVRQVFAEMNMELKFGKKPVTVTKLGVPLKQAIWWIIRNEHKPWQEIEPIDSQSFKVPNLYGRFN